MKRKVNLVGENTLTISLPSKWAKLNSVKKGDELELAENGKTLTILPPGNQSLAKEKRVEFGKVDNQFIRLKLNNLYRIGFDKIEIKFDNIKQFEFIQEMSNNHFLGFEVTKNEQNYCVLENVTEPNPEKYEILLRRIFLIIKESLIMLCEDFKSHKHTLYSVIRQQFNKTEQFCNFCMRTINKNGVSGISTLNYLFIYDLLVLVGEIRHMYEYLDKNQDLKLSAEIITLVEKIEKLFDKFYSIYFKKDQKSLYDLNHDAKSLLYNDTYAILNNCKGRETVVAFHLSIFIRHITLIVSPTIGIQES